MRLVAFLLFSSIAVAQQTATTSAPCSPIAPNNSGSITINCPGMSKEEGQKMLAILNKILANQIDPDTVMAKLDEIQNGINEIHTTVALRKITPSQASAIAARMKQFAGQEYSGQLPTSSPDARELWVAIDGALIAAQWKRIAPPGLSVGEPPAGISIESPVGILVAVEVDASPTTIEVAQNLSHVLVSEAHLAASVGFIGMQVGFTPRPATIRIIIGTKPQ